MKTLVRLGTAIAIVAGGIAPTGYAASPAVAQTMAQAGTPLFDAEVARATRFVGEMMAAGINVPMPRDPGGGYTHEQHKKNYRAIAEAGELFRITGDKTYANFVRDMLLAYAELYFTPVLWPDFDEAEFSGAVASFVARERRFGCTGEQIRELIAAQQTG